METTRTDAFSQVPTAVGTPELTTSSPISKEKSAPNGGVILTATNTIDTLTLDEDRQAVAKEEQDGNQPQLHKVSTLRKIALLSMFTFAEFLDA
ncbi:hypothetical protein FRC19_001733, partial [Serendipita sp. 401]